MVCLDEAPQHGRYSDAKVANRRLVVTVCGYGARRLHMLPMPSGAVVAFLDTEGFSASDRTADYDAKIFALSALLSSHLLYNSVRIIDTASIERVPTPPPRAPSPPRIQHKQGVDPQRKILCVCVCVC